MPCAYYVLLPFSHSIQLLIPFLNLDKETILHILRKIGNLAAKYEMSFLAIGVPIAVFAILISIVVVVIAVYLYKKKRASSGIPYSSRDFNTGSVA